MVKNPGVREAACQALLRPQVEYASTICSPYTKQDISKVEMVQRRAVRWTLHNYSPYSSVTELQHELGWRSLEQRRSDARLVMVCKIINGHIAITLPSYFQQPTRMTRHSHPLALRQIYTSFNFYKYSFYPLAVVLWNRLPTNVVVLPTQEQFREAVRSLDLSCYKAKETLLSTCFTCLSPLFNILTLSSFISALHSFKNFSNCLDAQILLHKILARGCCSINR